MNRDHSSAQPAQTPRLSVAGERFLLDGAPFKMWGVRVGNHLEDDAHTQDLLDHLDEWRAHGINTITPFLQGASTGTAQGFRADGSLEPVYFARLERLLEATAERGMAMIVGLFYKSKVQHFTGVAAVERAVANAAEWLRPYRHAAINVANEYHSPVYDSASYPFRDPKSLARLFDVIHEVDPERLVGAQARGWEFVVPVAHAADIAIHDDPIIAEELLFTHKVGKPVIDVEGAGHALDHWKGGVPGVFDEGAQLYFRQQIHSCNAIPGKNIFFHAHWIQMPPRRCALGGNGTPEDPGIHWYFDLLARVLGLTPHGDEWCLPPWERMWNEGRKGVGYQRFTAAAKEPVGATA